MSRKRRKIILPEHLRQVLPWTQLLQLPLLPASGVCHAFLTASEQTFMPLINCPGSKPSCTFFFAFDGFQICNVVYLREPEVSGNATGNSLADRFGCKVKIGRQKPVGNAVAQSTEGGIAKNLDILINC